MGREGGGGGREGGGGGRESGEEMRVGRVEVEEVDVVGRMEVGEGVDLHPNFGHI